MKSIHPLILLILIASITSCQPVKYSIRQHQRKVIEKETQREHSRTGSRLNRNISRGPRGYWPFNFLQ